MASKRRKKLNIAERLREERGRLGLIQADAAKAAGVGYTTYLGYEKGERFPNAESLHGLFLAGFDVLYVVTGTRNNSTLSTEQAAVLEQFGKLDDKGRAVTLAVMQTYNAL